MTRNNYIYFRRFMVRKRDAAIFAVLFLLIVVVGAVIYINWPTAEEKENNAITKGEMRTMGGRVIEVDTDKKMFVIDTDPLGQSKKYNIYVNEKTEFGALIFKIKKTNAEVVGGYPVYDSESFKRPEPERRDATFSDIEIGAGVEVVFEDRVDVDGRDKLKAQSVLLIIK